MPSKESKKKKPAQIDQQTVCSQCLNDPEITYLVDGVESRCDLCGGASQLEEQTNELRIRLQEVKDGTIELEDWEVVRARLANRQRQ